MLVESETVQFLLKLLLKQRILAVYHSFHWLLVAAKFLAAKHHLRHAGPDLVDARPWANPLVRPPLP